MPNVSSFGTQTDNSVVQGTVTDRAMVIPDVPPSGLESVGPRITPHFVKPSLWSALTTYHFFDAVHDAAGASYVAIKPEVPAGTELTDERYWFLWADPNSQFTDLSELVKTYNGRITQNTNDIAKTNENLTAQIAKTNENLTAQIAKTNENLTAQINMTTNKDVNLAIFSDSTFQRNVNPDTQKVVKSVVNWLEEFTDATVTNYGVGGTDTNWLINRIKQIPTSELLNIDVIIVAYGTNDWQNQVNPIQIVNNATDSLEYRYNEAINLLLQKAPKANIICVTPGYIHSNQASDEPHTLNYNKTGNSYKTYCDVIEHVANKNNCSVLRLDELLTINEINYTTQMISSANDIWVHYNETTTKKIAKMIANNLFKPTTSNTTGKYIDVTPRALSNMCTFKKYYGLGERYGFTSSQSVTFNVTTMIGVEYCISFIGGACEIVVDNKVISRSTKQSIVSTTFKATSNTTVVTLKYLESLGDIQVFNPKITIGRPNIYNATAENTPKTSGETATTDFILKYTTLYNFSQIQLTLKSSASVTVTDFAKSVLKMPQNLIGSYKGFGYGRKDGAIKKIFIRADNDGNVYFDCENGTYTNVNATLTGFLN